MSSRPRFHVTVKITELTNIPQNTGSVYVKWYLKDSPKPDARGRTSTEPIVHHRANWTYEGSTTVRIGIDRANVLRHIWVIFDIQWEHAGSGKMSLGKVELNLAEYVNRNEEMNRYLLKQSKINSVLNVVITMRQTKGTTDYTVPEFSAPQIFGDITGVMNEQKARGHRRESVPGPQASILSRLHHHTFAVSWNPKPGNLSPEECIEDIFAGGDGFGDNSIDAVVTDMESLKPRSEASVPDDKSESDTPNVQTRRQAPSGTNPDFSDERHHVRLLREDEERDGFRSWVLHSVTP